MLIDGMQVAEGSPIGNLTVASGTSFPDNPNLGELFFNTTIGALCIHNGADWKTISVLTAAGKIDVALLSSEVATLVGGKIQNSHLPALAITDTYVVGSQAAMLALSAAETGDVAVRTDLNKSFILKGASYSTLADWQELLAPGLQVLTGLPYDISFPVFDKPTASEVVFRFRAARAFTLSSSGNLAVANAAATGSTTFIVAKNGTQIGTVVFAAAGTTATCTITQTSFAIGDKMTVTAPGTADATLADIDFSFIASLN